MDSLTQDHMILARSKLWTSEVEKLLRKWRLQISKRERGHSESNRKYHRLHYIFGIPTTVVVALSSIGIFATFRNCDACEDQSQEKCAADVYIRIASGVVCVIAMILSSLMTFMNYSSSASEHKEASSEYGSLGRYIDSLVLIPPPLRGDPQVVLQNIRSQYDTNVRRYPSLDRKYEVELNYQTVDISKLHSKPPRPEDVPDIHTPEIIGQMAEMIHSSSSQNLDDIMAEENDHSTDDEQHEVKLTFDLDVPSICDPTMAALAAAQLAMHRDKQIQNSLTAALAFEMQRLDSHTPRDSHPRNRRYAAQPPHEEHIHMGSDDSPP
jgi:hypothetical protein